MEHMNPSSMQVYHPDVPQTGDITKFQELHTPWHVGAGGCTSRCPYLA